jgi:hypothetical protein
MLPPPIIMSLRASLFLATIVGVATAGAAPDDALFTAILQDHVDKGAVDYPAIAKDERLQTYLDQLAATDPATLPSRDAQLALWINAYNAYTLKLVASVDGISSIREITGLGTAGDPDSAKPWDQPIAIIGGDTYTLNQVEHEIIRPEFGDARIHFALVCAAYSCPILRREAYAADQLDAQLDDQGRWFMKHRNELDPRSRTAGLSQLFNWFAEDFGDDQNAILRYAAQFVTHPAIANSLRNEPHRWKVHYLDYDWSLNDR